MALYTYIQFRICKDTVMTKKTQSLKIGISCPQEVGFQPRTGEGDTYLWLYTRRKKKRGFSLRTEFPCTERQSGICTLCVAARREKSARCCNCFAEPLQIGLHFHCNRLAPPLQQACSITATALQLHCNRLAAKLQRVCSRTDRESDETSSLSAFHVSCSPSAVISFPNIDCA